MKDQVYTIPQLVKWFNLEYHMIYHYVTNGRVHVQRSCDDPKRCELTVRHSTLSKFLLTVDWLTHPSVLKQDHPFGAEYRQFERLYIHRKQLAHDIGYGEMTTYNWV